jgi:HD superfamily phosphodiesterase
MGVITDSLPVEDWLFLLKRDLEQISLAAARHHWPGPSDDSPPYFNYRLEHVRQVEREALYLLDEIGGDRDIILASVWLHDRFQPQFNGYEHARRAGEWAAENLASLGFPHLKIGAVVYTVANHSNPPRSIPEEAHEARLLWDADKLTKIGPLSIITYLCSNPAFPQNPVSFASIARRGLERLPEQRARIDLFYFEPSRRLAHHRYAAQQAFYKALAEQVGIGTMSM